MTQPINRFEQIPITEHYKVISLNDNGSMLWCDHCQKNFYVSPNERMTLMEINNASTTHANNGAG